MPLPYWSATFATRTSGKAGGTGASCWLPEITETEAGASGVCVSAKGAEPEPVSGVAVMLYAPATVLAVKVLDVAWPELSVLTRHSLLGVPPVFCAQEAKAALAPEPAGAVNWTVSPAGTGLPYWSSTSTTRASVKGWATVACCPAPWTAFRMAGAPGLLCMGKLAVSAPLLISARVPQSPAIRLAVTVELVACPDELVMLVCWMVPPGNVPLGWVLPLGARANVTGVPDRT